MAKEDELSLLKSEYAALTEEKEAHFGIQNK